MLTASQRIIKLAGKAIAEFEMIRAGDRLAVGLSGGKDSMALLHALLALQARAPIRFELAAFTIQQGKFMAPIEGLRAHLEELGVAWEVVEDKPSVRLVREGVEHGCDICSRYRRRAVYQTARRLGCNVVAFGHTADDFAEAMVRNLVFTGRVKPLPPMVMSSENEFRLIRPLVYVREELIRQQATAEIFPIVPCACSLKEGTRQAVRGFLRQVAEGNPHIYSNIIAAGVRAWKTNGVPAADAEFGADDSEEAEDMTIS